MVDTPDTPGNGDSQAPTAANDSNPAAESEAKASAGGPAADAGAEGAEHDESSDGEGDGEGDHAEAGPEGPEGPEGPGGEKKKKKRRRKKSGGSAGPEGPPIEAAGGGGSGEEPRGERKPRGEKKPVDPARADRASFQIGEEVFGKVTSVLDTAIMIDLAGKALAIFDRTELAADDMVPSPGDRFVAHVLGDGSRGGFVVLSRNLLREEATKPKVEQAFKDKTTVDGLITGIIKGGVEVYVEGLRAFAPASHVDLRHGADLTHLVGQRLPFFVEQYAKKGRDVVVSRKPLLEDEAKKLRESSLAKLTEGAKVKGVVRTIVDWGVFVAIPEADSVEGLVHISELSHDPRARARDLLKVGDEIEVKIQKIDEKGKLWLSKRACEPDPWEELRTRYAQGTRHKGRVTKIQPFGAFVELEPGLEGLIHLADLSIKRIERPDDVVKVGQDIDVVVASLDLSTKKIGLHPTLGNENEPRQKVAPHKMVRIAVVAHDPGGLIVRILGATGRSARGFVPAGHTGTPRGTDLRKHFPAGSEHDVKVIEIDPRRGEAKMSIKALREDSEKAAYNEYRAAVAKESKFGTFADLLKKSSSLDRMPRAASRGPCLSGPPRAALV